MNNIREWNMMWSPHRYFADFEIMVDQVFFWIMIAFASINLAAMIFCAIRNKGFNEGFFRMWGLSIWYNILGLIVLFAIASNIYSLGVFFKSQYWNLPRSYYRILVHEVWYMILCAAVVLVVTIISAFVIQWYCLIILIGGFPFLLWGGGFVIYCVVWFIWLIIRILYVIVTVFGLSLYLFTVAHWWVLLLNLAVPAIIIGLILALGSYTLALKNNVSMVLTDGDIYHENTPTTTRGRKKKQDPSPSDDEDIFIKSEN